MRKLQCNNNNKRAFAFYAQEAGSTSILFDPESQYVEPETEADRRAGYSDRDKGQAKEKRYVQYNLS